MESREADDVRGLVNIRITPGSGKPLSLWLCFPLDHSLPVLEQCVMAREPPLCAGHRIYQISECAGSTAECNDPQPKQPCRC